VGFDERTLTGVISGRILEGITGTNHAEGTRPAHHDDLGEMMSSEHAIERVPLSEIREGDMLQDPRSGRWIKITRTADDSMSVATNHSDGDGTVLEEYRVYYGDGGEKIDSRSVTGLVNRQVRE
jgi:hypothetical protein